MSKKLLPSGKCPYCGLEQTLEYPNVKPLDDIYSINKMEDTIITDSFNEVDQKIKCKGCGKEFHFIHNITESIYNRKGMK